MMHISSLQSMMTIHPASRAQLVLLLGKQFIVLAECLDFTDVFSERSANVLPEETGVNEYAIKLEQGKQSPYEPIYSLELVELKIFKTYIETNLANGFIRASKSPADTLILFARKPNGSLCLCVNYQKLNNLTIKNRYLLPLIGKFLYWLSQTKQFTQLNLTSVYLWIRIIEDDK